MSRNDEYFMRLAIAKAAEGMKNNNTPFGACLAKDGEVISCCHNQVLEALDITAHAEIVALRECCAKTGRIDLEGFTLYTTCEPCPMCFSAAHWANVSRIVFGARIEDAAAAGFRELRISNQKMKALGPSAVELCGPVLADEARALFKAFDELPGKKTY